MKVKVRKIGDSSTITLPTEIAQALHLNENDDVFLVLHENGVSITVYDPALDQKVIAVKDIADRYRNTLRALS
jgi:putative addiction module antidote